MMICRIILFFIALTTIISGCTKVSEGLEPVSDFDTTNLIKVSHDKPDGGMQYMDKESKGLNKVISPCPKSPNCVSSLDKDERHAVEPIGFSGGVKDARERILDILNNTKRVRIVNSDENFIHAEFTSSIFRFVDDVEFFFDDPNEIIHVKSASRLGYYDFGVNRRRIENIRKRFNQIDK